MRRSIVRSVTVANLFALALFSSAYGADPGRAVGTLTVDAAVTPLEFAVATRKDDLFDATRKDTVIVLTDKRLGNTRPDDEIDLSVRARRGDLVALALRIDGSTLVNVTVSHKAAKGLVILPGSWFQYSATRTGSTLKMAVREYEGHSYAVDVAFAPAPYVRPQPAAAPIRPPATAPVLPIAR